MGIVDRNLFDVLGEELPSAPRGDDFEISAIFRTEAPDQPGN
jgi:hypothetical protein